METLKKFCGQEVQEDVNLVSKEEHKQDSVEGKYENQTEKNSPEIASSDDDIIVRPQPTEVSKAVNKVAGKSCLPAISQI